MKNKHKPWLIAVCIALLLSGCGKASNNTVSYNDKVTEGISDEVVYKSSDYEIEWDDENKCVLLKNTVNNSIWSTIPYEYMLSGGMSANVTSPINITVSDNNTLKSSTVRGSSGVISSGRVIAEKLDNGIRVTYYFDEQKISIPVTYKLCDGEMVVTLESSGIVEASNYKLLDVSIAPFLCSAKNNARNYLFIPSYSGELMYTKADTGGTRKYKASVYGEDMAHLLPIPQEYKSEVKMPVFGAKDGKKALFAIIENGAEHVTIEAEAGNDRTEWSTVSPKITVRGVDVVETQLPQATLEDIPYVSEERIKDDVSIRYIPLNGEEADYNGMARCYRKYLINNKLLEEKSVTGSPYSVTVYGGAQISQLFMGVPYKTTVALTTFGQTQDIIDKLIKNTGVAPGVQLIGFGESGINFGKVGGGFGFCGSIGNDNELDGLLDFFGKKNISYYFDYDIARYNESSSGFSAGSDIAKTASEHRATLNVVDVALAGYTDEEYHLLTRKKLYDAAERLIESAQDRINGVSLNSLRNFSYSDYSDGQYVAKANYGKQITEIINDIKKKGIDFSASNPNIYSGLMADSIFDFTQKTDFVALNQSVPFYQMVLSGTKAMYSNPVNTSNNPKQQIMLAAAYGLGLNFEVIGRYNTDVNLSGYSFYGAVFEAQEDTISRYVKEYLDDFSKIKGAAITEYKMISPQISKTVYSNGTVVYANHTSSAATASDIALQGFEYKVVEQ